ncbi:MAG: hypothetical protein ABIJ57_13670 [Pseudomonadota bacterium]
MKPKFELLQGYSAVDHFGPELVRMCEEAAKDCRSRAGAIRHGEAVVRRVKRRHNAARKAQGYATIFTLPSIRVEA